MLNIKNDQSNKMKAVTIERPINTNVDHGCTEKFPLSKNLYQQYILKTTLLNFSIDIFYDFNTFYQTLQSYPLYDPILFVEHSISLFLEICYTICENKNKSWNNHPQC